MAGYFKNSKSNNALAAENEGFYPRTKWSKADFVAADPRLAKLSLATLRDKCLAYKGWHHTSSRYNETAYYDLDEAYISRLLDADIDALSFAEKETRKAAAAAAKAKKATPWAATCVLKKATWGGSIAHPQIIRWTLIDINDERRDRSGKKYRECNSDEILTLEEAADERARIAAEEAQAAAKRARLAAERKRLIAVAAERARLAAPKKAKDVVKPVDLERSRQEQALLFLKNRKDEILRGEDMATEIFLQTKEKIADLIIKNKTLFLSILLEKLKITVPEGSPYNREKRKHIIADFDNGIRYSNVMKAVYILEGFGVDIEKVALS